MPLLIVFEDISFHNEAIFLTQGILSLAAFINWSNSMDYSEKAGHSYNSIEKEQFEHKSSDSFSRAFMFWGVSLTIGVIRDIVINIHDRRLKNEITKNKQELIEIDEKLKRYSLGKFLHKNINRLNIDVNLINSNLVLKYTYRF